MTHPKKILLSLELRPRKNLSQSFLCDAHWAERLTDLVLDTPTVDEIWEIGPGLGALTGPLSRKARSPITLFEYDRKLVPFLRKEFPKIQVIESDFLKIDWEKHLPKGKTIAVLSNLPYHLSSPILFKFLERRDQVSRLVFTFQKEFAERLVARPGSKTYGALSVQIQSYFKVNSVGRLPPHLFFPNPAVHSEALLLEPLFNSPVPEKILGLITRSAFAHRRKKALSNLKSAFPSAPWDTLFDELGIDPGFRAEVLPRTTYLELARRWALFAKDNAESRPEC